MGPYLYSITCFDVRSICVREVWAIMSQTLGVISLMPPLCLSPREEPSEPLGKERGRGKKSSGFEKEKLTKMVIGTEIETEIETKAMTES